MKVDATLSFQAEGLGLGKHAIITCTRVVSAATVRHRPSVRMRPCSFISRDMSSVQAILMNSVPNRAHSSLVIFSNKTSKTASKAESPQAQYMEPTPAGLPKGTWPSSFFVWSSSK